MALDYKSGLSRYRRYLQVVREQPLLRAGVWTALSLLLVIVMITMALKPTLVVIAGLLGQIRQNKEIITKLDDKIVKIQLASSELDKISTRLPVLDEALPTNPDWDKWSRQIFDIASSSGVQLVSVSVGPVPISGTWESAKGEIINLPSGVNGLSFTVSATGNYEKLKGMVVAMENTRRLNILSNVQFSSVKNKTGGLDLSVYIRGVAVYAQL
jgi:hypothetical protein